MKIRMKWNNNNKNRRISCQNPFGGFPERQRSIVLRYIYTWICNAEWNVHEYQLKKKSL